MCGETFFGNGFVKKLTKKTYTGYVISNRKCLKRTLTFISYSDLMKTIEILLRAYFIIGLQWFKSEIMKVYILQTAVQVGIACKNAPVTRSTTSLIRFELALQFKIYRLL